MENLREDIELIPCPDIACMAPSTRILEGTDCWWESTILAIYSNPAYYLVMPLQNSIHGAVSETLDCLLSSFNSSSSSDHESGPGPSRPWLMGDLVLPIRHCLVAKKGVKQKDIRWVRSHEQVSDWSTCFPDRATNASSCWTVFRLLDSARSFFPLICQKPNAKSGRPQLEQQYLSSKMTHERELRFVRSQFWSFILIW